MGPTAPPGQVTTLPYAFIAGTLHNPATGVWNIDTVDRNGHPRIKGTSSSSDKSAVAVEIDFTWSFGFFSVELAASVEARISLMMVEFSSCLLAESAMNLDNDSSIVSLRAWYKEFPLFLW
ncbi:hypothetical protein Tco_0088688 [Tanacetum coccineum]